MVVTGLHGMQVEKTVAAMTELGFTDITTVEARPPILLQLPYAMSGIAYAVLSYGICWEQAYISHMSDRFKTYASDPLLDLSQQSMKRLSAAYE
eukprot:3518191-Rhodomonas_salina.1